MLAAVLALTLAAPAAAPALPLESALARELASPAFRLQLVEARPAPAPSCLFEAAEVDRRIAASGRYAVKLSGATSDGARCDGWIWARVKVLTDVRVTTRSLKAGEGFEGATALESREILAGREPVSELPAGAVAARPLAARQIVEGHHLRTSGANPGDAVTVLVQAGTVSIVQEGRIVPCARGRACAQLPSGRRVEGRFEGGKLLVEVP